MGGPDTSNHDSADDDLRCLCGRLLAKAQPEGVELKCPRCKRAVLIPWAALATGEVDVQLVGER